MDEAVFVIQAHSRPGVLAKIASMFYRRGLNIHTLTVRPMPSPEMARIVIGIAGPSLELQRLALSIGNLIDVIRVELEEEN
jgi:acetolactate synthase-1/3 small subunit